MSKKDFLSKFIFKNKLASKVLSKRSQKNIHILAYHRIVEELSNEYIFNSEIFSATTSEFDRQMEYLSNNFNVINFTQLEMGLINNDLKDNSVIVTFDDGYYDNYSLAMPVLNKYNIGATVFLATDYIDSGDLFWFDVVSGFIKSYDGSKLDLESMDLKFNLNDISKHQAFKIVGRELKSLDDSKRVNLLSEINDKFNFSISDEHYQQAKPLSWDNVIEMSNHDIEFGSHTKSHCFLNCIDSTSLESELRESKVKIENKIGKEINSFCYPAGVTNTSIKNMVKSCGYYFGVGYRHGVNDKDYMDLYDLYREHIEPDVNFDLFRANVTLPEIFMRKVKS